MVSAIRATFTDCSLGAYFVTLPAIRRCLSCCFFCTLCSLPPFLLLGEILALDGVVRLHLARTILTILAQHFVVEEANVSSFVCRILDTWAQ